MTCARLPLIPSSKSQLHALPEALQPAINISLVLSVFEELLYLSPQIDSFHTNSFSLHHFFFLLFSMFRFGELLVSGANESSIAESKRPRLASGAAPSGGSVEDDKWMSDC
ncbi:hypothetical protein E2C01_102176 [Portunus trituberculatus]|uniref:Uncharacterized protein n=1 Tax=Portunus trituberculatus TaxID=210409 RepID=A0A5B7KLZ6_PORTR|nr:hypothetical protein [Portunus trituberculatus]